MAEIDEVLWAETREHLMAVVDAEDDELAMIVEEQLQDMKECGFFDIPEEFQCCSYDDDDSEW
jgi:hypothetical protein